MKVQQEPGERRLGVPSRPETVALVALILGSSYLLWRTTTLGDGHRLWWSVPLYVTELWSFGQLGLFCLQAWRICDPVLPSDRQDVAPMPPVDVIINANDADPAALERSLVGAAALAGRGDVRVVDGSDREAVGSVARMFGVDYVVDETVEVGPAAAMHRQARSAFYVWLEAGQVPMPAMLERIPARFADPNLAVCQFAVGLLNADSLVHLRAGRDEDALLREVVGPGLNRLGAAPWFGPASIIRRAAVDAIGGFVEADPAAVERAKTLLHGRGWTSAFEAEQLVRGLAPDTLDDYLEQRRLRVVRALRVFRTPQNPLTVRGPGERKALMSLAGALSFGTGVRQLIAVTVLVGTLLTGDLPFDAPIWPMLGFWALATGSATAARRALSRGTMAVGDWTRHGWRTLGVDLGAAWAVARGRCGDSPSSRQTRTSGVRALGRLRLLTGAVVVLDLALLVRAITLFDHDLLPAFSTSERVLVMGVGVLLLVPMVDVLQVVVLRRQRRRQFRLEVGLDIEVASTRATTLDLTPVGVGLVMGQAPPIGTVVPVRLRLPVLGGGHRWIEGSAVARSASLHHGGLVRVGLEFGDLDDPSRHALIGFCMIGHAAAGGEPERPDLAVAHPHQLEVDRRGRHHRSLQLLTATAALSTVGDPAARPGRGCRLGRRGRIARRGLRAHRLGGTGGRCHHRTPDRKRRPKPRRHRRRTVASPLDGVPVTAELSASHQSVRNNGRPTIADGRAVFAMVSYCVRLIDTTGRAVPGAGVRYFTERWYRAATTDDSGRARFEALGPDTSIELTWQDRRYVHRPDGLATTVVMGRIDVGDPGPAVGGDRLVTDIDRGAGWEPFVDGADLLPGRFALRLADGTTIKAEVLPGHVFTVATGRLTDLRVTVADDLIDAATTTSSSTTAPSGTTASSSSSSTIRSSTSTERSTAPSSTALLSTSTTSSSIASSSTATSSTTALSSTAAPSTAAVAIVTPPTPVP